jgi:outer membrane lipoprotein LolB
MAVLLAAGCSTVPPPASGDVLAGRLVLQISPGAHTPAQQWSAGFELRGSAQAGELDLTSPLGTTVAQARWRPGQAELDQGGERRAFPDLGELSRQLLGENVPLEALFDWLRGRPWPAASHERTAQGFVQQGWAVDLSGLGEGRLTARRDQAPTILLRARLEVAP